MDFFTNSTPKAFTRRSFLHHGLVLTSAAVTIPAFLQRSAYAMQAPRGLSSIPGVPEDRVLVVVQLGGGNDGLNTVVPFADPAYAKARPSIAIPQRSVLKLSGHDGVGLHPQLTGLRDLYDQGLVSIYQGVGYPNPNRSHFKSMDIWQTADVSGTGTGWLGRFFDNECCGKPTETGSRPTPDPMAGVAIGREAPLAMQGTFSKPIGFENPELFRWLGSGVDASLTTPYQDLVKPEHTDGAHPESQAAFLTRTALDAQLSSEQIRKAVARRPETPYPGNELARQLAMVSSMIRAGLKTRVYYVTLGGFDTHAGQGGENGRHAQLMNQLGSSLLAFYSDLKSQGNDGRVMTLTFSEFGRRVAQNASGGTDHGTAAPMFLAGPMVRPGLFGDQPSLTDLDQGDLKHTLDFRSVYAGVLEHWLKADSKAVLEGVFRPVQALRT
jgi:uncharacterized protein (DUF1501 family)